ncbi:NIL domain-containing protein [Wukongibacter sp. M2B1]|uniref:NIL domain-containing protein n=1 Tax=Wukongibacter sp. M2B1 TaxID=3088895 RepID=UPI003D79669F
MKKLLLLSFPTNLTGEPITYTLIKNYDLKINILRASIDYNIEGSLFLEVDGLEEKINLSIEYLKIVGVKVKVIKTAITINEDECVNCGACTSICEVGALTMSDDWKISFHKDRCLDCKLCIKACPVRAIASIV